MFCHSSRETWKKFIFQPEMISSHRSSFFQSILQTFLCQNNFNLSSLLHLYFHTSIKITQVTDAINVLKTLYRMISGIPSLSSKSELSVSRYELSNLMQC